MTNAKRQLRVKDGRTATLPLRAADDPEGPGAPSRPPVGANGLTSEQQAEVVGNPQARCVKLLVCHQRDRGPRLGLESLGVSEATGGEQQLVTDGQARSPGLEFHFHGSHGRLAFLHLLLLSLCISVCC